MDLPDVWVKVFRFLIGTTLFEDHADLRAECAVVSVDIRKIWLTVEDPCIVASHEVYRTVAKTRVDRALMRRFMYSKARRARDKDLRLSGTSQCGSPSIRIFSGAPPHVQPR
jgi:hypothetical protein